MSGFKEALVVVKHDAIEDGVASDVVRFVEENPNVTVRSQSRLELATDEILSFYAPELQADPSERREILMAMGAQAMTGTNLFLGVQVLGMQSQEDAFSYLNKFKGSINDTPADETIRGTFAFPRPREYEAYSFWFQAPFFVRNRVHIPDSTEALGAIEAIALERGIDAGQLYGRK